jgi:3-oxoacyl-[acyl-carrier protein] reductase
MSSHAVPIIIFLSQRGTMDTGLKQKSVIITGASDGMGKATAELFAAEGARIAIAARTEKKLNAVADLLRSKYKAEVLAYPLDVTDESSVNAFVKSVAEKFGRVDVAVANAGGPPPKNFLSISLDEWRKAVELSFLSVVSLAKAVIPHMQRNQWGRFVTITSVSVKQPIPDLILSNSVRPGVVGLVKSLAGEFGKDGITFNNVAPGYTATERLSELAGTRALAAGVSEEQIYEQWSANIPMRRLAKPEEIGDAILWLASDRAAYITGQTIVVDGGNYRGM